MPCELSRSGSVCRGPALRVLSPTCTRVAPRCSAQALDDHSVRHTRILEALEAEKQKIAQEVQALQQNRGGKDRAPPVPTSWGSLKLSLMIQEANALSGRAQRQFVFGRHEAPDRGGGPGPQVRVWNLRLGVSTLWSLEKFESKLAALKELESNCQCEDLFCDPEDEWEPDLTDAPAASFSRRRLEAEIQEAQLRAKQEMLQGIQVAKEVAEQELSSQRAAFEGRIEALQAELEDLVGALWDGVGAGVRLLVDSGLEQAEELRRELSGQHPQSEAAQQLHAKAEALIGCLETIFAEWRTKSSHPPAQGEPSGGGALREMAGRAPEMLDLTRCLEQTIGAVVSALRDRSQRRSDRSQRVSFLCLSQRRAE
ncbi:Kinesin-like protein KIF14 [Myotis davidii]|uniref:Kinesin-like protein KIF14 n=1 Tax=Myotis davidii TaxID=225400 RepID=L5LG95_MYODS|nr:Kinesin-like protein KIF14 [Myotis davidii]